MLHPLCSIGGIRQYLDPEQGRKRDKEMNINGTLDVEDEIEDSFPDGVIVVRREMEYDIQDAMRIARAQNDGLDPTMEDILDVVKDWAQGDFGCVVRGNCEMRFCNTDGEGVGFL